MTNKEFLSIIQKEASSANYNRYLKQLVYKKISSDDNIAFLK